MSAGKHARLWGAPAASRDLALTNAEAPKHRASHARCPFCGDLLAEHTALGCGVLGCGCRHAPAHVHDWEVVAEFTGLRAALLQCRQCGETRTVWRTPEMDAAR